MKEIVADKDLVAFCGLYCGACKRYLREKCPGCAKNEKATWCKVRTCCMSNDYLSCADCRIVDDLADCKKLNNIIAKIFSFILRSDRQACLRLVKEKGCEEYAQTMAGEKKMTIKR